jgi:hypothetical protein
MAQYGREGLDPALMLKSLSGTFVKERGGEQKHRAWEHIEKITEGYNEARYLALKAVEAKDHRRANQIMLEWNKSLKPKLTAIEATGYKDRGGLLREFLFTGEKRENIHSKRDVQTDPLDERLMRKR